MPVHDDWKWALGGINENYVQKCTYCNCQAMTFEIIMINTLSVLIILMLHITCTSNELQNYMYV